MNITIHQARDLALRILGLYSVLQLFQSLPRAAWLATMKPDTTYPGNPMIEMFGEIVVATVYLVAAYLLLRRTDFLARRIWRADERVAESQPAQGIATVDFWVRLIGVYFLIWSLAAVASVIWYWIPGFRYGVEFSSGYGASRMIQHGVMLVLAIVCIRWPDAPFRLFRPLHVPDDEVLGS